MKFKILVSLCFLNIVFSLDTQQPGNTNRGARKLFGGYRITPRLCKPSRSLEEAGRSSSVCMFNHECIQRNGNVVGACMDGFLFGACCQLPAKEATGELLSSDINPVNTVENTLVVRPSPSAWVTNKPETTSSFDITSNGVSQITAALLNPNILPTAQDNAIVQVNHEEPPYFSTTGVTHPDFPDTVLLNQQQNDIDPGYFMPTKQPFIEDRKTTIKGEDTTLPYSHSPIIHVSVSNAPLEYTTSAGFQRPMFRPKPSISEDHYVLVPTISHETSKPNKTQEHGSTENVLDTSSSTFTKFTQTNAQSSTSNPSSNSYVYGSTQEPFTDYETTPKLPSTSYVFSTTIPPRRTESPETTTKKKPSRKTKPTKSTTNRPYASTKRPPVAVAIHLTPSKTTVANSAAAFVTTQRPSSTSTYVFNSTPTRQPPSTVVTHIGGPGFSVTSHPGIISSDPAQYQNYPSPAPTVIVLGPVTENEIVPELHPIAPVTYQQYPGLVQQPATVPQRKPINQVTINNHVTQNIYSTSESPSPTVVITPKPSISSSLRPQVESDIVEVVSASDELVNFPPVRNPNLNMSSIPLLGEDDITTPGFIEDDALNLNVESFVNKIIQGLQEPFQGLKDIVYDRNNSTILSGSTTKSPIRRPSSTTTKNPVRTTTTRPTTSANVRPGTSTRPTTRPATTRRTTTRRPTTTPTRRQTTTTTRRRTTKKPVTTTQNFIDHETESIAIDSDDYRTQCGVRPLVKTGRIVGGKGAVFGEFPWQVLVRESTWLGLFTKNKCGGVLISNKYVMTAAHCQPGFLASLVAVFGEFDISGDLESKRPISRNVKRVIVHRQYDPATFQNDLALLELEHPVQFDAHIIPICLPRDGEDFTGRMATVTGWGRLKYGGGVPSVLQEVQVPIMENHICQQMFRTAGHSKVIMESFLCAGYVNGEKDSCEGDSGGPLVLPRPDGRYQLAGTVSHGIKCAAPYLPGVYMRTQYFKPWITSITGVTSP